MKVKRTNKKLELNKVTVTALDRDLQKVMKGGIIFETRMVVTVCYTICATDCEGQACLANG
jgi:hypothetical protein